jgi:hypothetical protein
VTLVDDGIRRAEPRTFNYTALLYRHDFFQANSTTIQPNMSGLSRELSADKDWEQLVALDEEIFDPLFQGDTSFTDGSYGYDDCYAVEAHRPESVGPEHPYRISTAPSMVGGLSSFEFNVSAAPSFIDEHSPAIDTFSLFSTSPSFSTTATSPIITGTDEAQFGSFNEYDYITFADHRVTESPHLELDELSPSWSVHALHAPTSQPFNPFIPGTAHSFNARDVNASQAFSNADGRAGQPRIVEPIPELEQSGGMAIPYANSPFTNLDDSFSSSAVTRSEHAAHSPAGAITIPMPNRRVEDYHAELPRSRWTPQVPPMLSVSPEARRRPRSTTISRSNSRNAARRTRNSLTTPSPTSNTFGWVSYQRDAKKNKLVPSSIDGNVGRRQKGRTTGLSTEGRKKAAAIRAIGACSNCQKRKDSCDDGFPCKSCLRYYKGGLINFPCRGRRLSDLWKTFLSDDMAWHPTARPIESFLGPNLFSVSRDITHTLPLTFGFGPALDVSIHPLQVGEINALYHNHIVYSWPPTQSNGDVHTHAVLPAVLTPNALFSLSQTLDAHLLHLVSQEAYFRLFPLYTSPLRILEDVYIFYRSLAIGSSQSQLLSQALKLLVLVHVGGDWTLPSCSESVLEQLARTTVGCVENHILPTPCFIRSQIGSVMPALAQSLMREVLSSLEQLLLNRVCQDWPTALAVMIVLLGTVESVHYHAAKLPYHYLYDGARHDSDAITPTRDQMVDDQGVGDIFKFYMACFSNCHSRLHEDVGPQEHAYPEDVFVDGVRKAVRWASSEGYLQKKATEERDSEDMAWFFDRLVAKFLLL